MRNIISRTLSSMVFLRVQAPWHFLYFLPLPHGQGSFRPTLGSCAIDADGRGAGREAVVSPKPAGVPNAETSAGDSAFGVARTRGWGRAAAGRAGRPARGAGSITRLARNRVRTVSSRIERVRSSNIANASRLYSTRGSRCP